MSTFIKTMVLCVSLMFATTTVTFANNAADLQITASVKTKLTTDNNLAGTTLNVKTKNGIVILSGKVHNKTQLEKALKIAKSVTGVKQVKSYVKMSSI